MKEENRKTLMLVMQQATSSALVKVLSDKTADVPERPGIKSDMKEAALEAAFTLLATSIASIIVRDFTREDLPYRVAARASRYGLRESARASGRNSCPRLGRGCRLL